MKKGGMKVPLRLRANDREHLQGHSTVQPAAFHCHREDQTSHKQEVRVLKQLSVHSLDMLSLENAHRPI